MKVLLVLGETTVFQNFLGVPSRNLTENYSYAEASIVAFRSLQVLMNFSIATS